ncbi:MAG: HAMP domain-containing histidine kinase [Bacteroides sp.]|nr:HAMP domain-containing histidine kinase [Bacteroides sp.]
MKKSLIWLLTIVMAITFGALLYFQITYLENMVRMREAQFSEGVMRSISSTAGFLEKSETLHYLEEDVNVLESHFFDESTAQIGSGAPTYSIEKNPGQRKNFTLSYPQAPQKVGSSYRHLQEAVRNQYLYQRGLLDEVIMEILQDASQRPLPERADSTTIRHFLTSELEANGVTIPFVFAVTGPQNEIIYATDGFDTDRNLETYTSPLFPHTDNQYSLKVMFPQKSTYIFSSVKFIIPTLALSIVLLVVFLLTIILIFRQKKLSEMKSDFINNMTHELKTPISTIDLAAQMLGDTSVHKSESTIRHLSDVITDETKRLRFQVDKVLQLSVLENSSTAINFTVVDANQIIDNVVNTFKIKAEKFGGSVTGLLEASRADIMVDKMQFTNVIFSLLDNAIKYKQEHIPPILSVTTKDLSHDRLEIRVKDNGIGIRKDDQKRVFERFYRVSTGNRHDVKGFGLGLAYVKKMVTLFGGTITVESELGKGSDFIIILPLTSEEQ